MAVDTSNAYIDYLLGESKDFDYEAEQKICRSFTAI